MDLREISQLMESYPQLIPKIDKMVEPLKAYIRRHSHGEKGENMSEKYFHFDCGSFEKGVGQGEFGEAIASTYTYCKYLVMFSLIYMLVPFPSSLCMFTLACLFLIDLVQTNLGRMRSIHCLFCLLNCITH
jgi:hypothetical protein